MRNVTYRMEDAVTTNEQMMQLLAARVPVTLLLDIAAPPDAAEVLRREGGDAQWLREVRTPAA
jgi:hypothetical protein